MRKEQTNKKLKLLMNNCTRSGHGIGREGCEEAVDDLFGGSCMNGWVGEGLRMCLVDVERGGWAWSNVVVVGV